MSPDDRAAALAAMSPEDRAAALAGLSTQDRAAAPFPEFIQDFLIEKYVTGWQHAYSSCECTF